MEYNVGEAGLLDKDNIAVIAGLKSAVSGGQFLVATTHLLFRSVLVMKLHLSSHFISISLSLSSPRRHEVRLAQTALLLAEVDRLAWRERGHLPLIITGDFNSRPNSPSFCLLKYGQARQRFCDL